MIFVFCLGVKLGRSHGGKNVGWGCQGRVVGERFVPERDGEQGNGVKCTVKSFMISRLSDIF
jgi:hypothetical protein